MDIAPIIRTNFLLFNHDETISGMISQLKKEKQRSGLVFKNDKYLGIVEKTKLIKVRLNPTESKITKHIEKTPILNEHADIIETAYLMHKSNAELIPIEQNKKIIGVVSSKDLVSLAMLTIPEIANSTIKDIKLTKLPIIQKDDPISKALDIMSKQNAEHLPVFEKGKIYGILSYLDVFNKYLNWKPDREVSSKFTKNQSTRSAESDRPNLGLLPVSMFSTNNNLVIMNEKNLLKETIKRLQENNISSAIILDKDKLKGLAEVKNIIRLIASLKIPQNFNIKFIGLNKIKNITAYDKKSIQKIASNEAFKLQRALHNEVFGLTIHFKQYHKEGTQHKNSVNIKIDYPGKMISVDQDDWDVIRALHKSFNNAKNAVSKMHHGDNDRKITNKFAKFEF